MGSAIGTAAGYFTIMSFNMYFVITKTHFVPSIRKIFLKPLIAGIACGITAYISTNVVSGFITSYKIRTAISIALAAAVYLVVIILIKGINRADVLMLPKGNKICALMDRFNMLDKEVNN